MINFNKNVNIFYEWFKTSHKDLENAITNNDLKMANEMLIPYLSTLLNTITFQLYKNNITNHYILELNTILDNSKKIICYYFCQKLTIPNWEFHYYHHPFHGAFMYNGLSISGNDIQIIPIANKIKRNFDLKIVKNKIFNGISEVDKFMIIYMVLIENLGEIIVDSYLGAIEFLDVVGSLKYSHLTKITIHDFLSYIMECCKKLDWTIPTTIVFVAEKYNHQSKEYAFRKDIIDGSSYCLDLLNEEGEKYTPLLNYIHHCGIGIFTLTSTFAPTMDKKEIEKQRTTLENTLLKIINIEHTGMIINSAKGNAHLYIDYLVYDEIMQDHIKKKFKDQKNIEIIEIKGEYND